jgi:RecJ-like exonuclease
MFLFLIALFISCDEESCWVCGGSGKCYNCNGKGYIKVDANVCDVCKGSGICFNCQGTGKIKKDNMYYLKIYNRSYF